jgi:hypothetical protein
MTPRAAPFLIRNFTRADLELLRSVHCQYRIVLFRHRRRRHVGLKKCYYGGGATVTARINYASLIFDKFSEAHVRHAIRSTHIF